MSDAPLVQRFGGAVLLQGRALIEVRRLLHAGIRAVWYQDSVPPSTLAVSIMTELKAATAAPGSAEVPQVDQPSQLAVERRISTADAAELLGIGERQARNLAPRLGGRKVGGTLTFDLAAVEAENETRRERQRS